MTFVVLIARHYDLFSFFAALADPQREISPAEGVLIAVLFAACFLVFVARRRREERTDEAYQERFEREMRELRELAMQDPLTKLPNRRVLLAALNAATADCAARQQRHAFFLMDLNGFKRVNDAYGHAVGDEVLQIVVERFRRVARPDDLLARLGGDEFAVLSCNVDREDAWAIGARFAAALRGAVNTEGHSHDIGVAIGAALIPEHGDSGDAILRHADLAMYRAKADTGSSLAFFDPKVDAPQASRHAG